MKPLDAETLEHQVQVSESVLARLFFVVKLPDGARAADVDVAGLERRIAAATRSWDDEFNAVADELPAQERGVEFGEAYESVFDPAVAVEDLRLPNAPPPPARAAPPPRRRLPSRSARRLVSARNDLRRTSNDAARR